VKFLDRTFDRAVFVRPHNRWSQGVACGG
jgi:hypothetical protein